LGAFDYYCAASVKKSLNLNWTTTIVDVGARNLSHQALFSFGEEEKFRQQESTHKKITKWLNAATGKALVHTCLQAFL
jgi:hypothetical protein